MTNSTDTSKTTEFPPVSGLGTVSVDGKRVYDAGDTFRDIGREIDEAVSGAVDASTKAATAAYQAQYNTADSGAHANTQNAHYPDPNTKSASSWAPFNKAGIWIGVILVTFGTLIFLDMLSDSVPALANLFGGYSFWRFWPLLIVFGGLALAFSPAKDSPDPRHNGRLSFLRFWEGLFTSTIGLVLLGASLNLVSWLVWPALLSFWPLLLVMGGLALLSYGLKTDWFSILSYIMSIIVLLAVASSMWTGTAPLIEPFASLAQFGAFRGMDLFNIGNEVGINFGLYR